MPSIPHSSHIFSFSAKPLQHLRYSACRVSTCPSNRYPELHNCDDGRKNIILGDRGYVSIYSITYRAAKHWLDKQDSLATCLIKQQTRDFLRELLYPWIERVFDMYNVFRFSIPLIYPFRCFFFLSLFLCSIFSPFFSIFSSRSRKK